MSVALSLDDLAEAYREKQKYTLAEPLFKRAIEIWEQAGGLEHPKLEKVLRHYAALLSATQRTAEAEKLLDRAAKIQKQR